VRDRLAPAHLLFSTLVHLGLIFLPDDLELARVVAHTHQPHVPIHLCENAEKWGVGCSTDHLNVADEWACNRRHRLRPRESSSSRQEPAVRTEGKLDVLCLEGRAPAVHCKLARKGCDVLDKVVGNVLHYLIFASRDA